MTPIHETAMQLKETHSHSLRALYVLSGLLLAFASVAYLMAESISVSLIISVMGSLLITIALVGYRVVQQSRVLNEFDEQVLDEVTMLVKLNRMRDKHSH